MNNLDLLSLEKSISNRVNDCLIKKLDDSIILYLNFRDYLKLLKGLLDNLNVITSNHEDYIIIRNYVNKVNDFIKESIKVKDKLYDSMNKVINLDDLLVLFELDSKGVKL